MRVLLARNKKFQSTPAIAGERDWAAKAHVLLDRRFNPRPPLLASETRFPSDWGADLQVSIHARHCWRARRSAGCSLGPRAVVSIHARHCWRARPFGAKAPAAVQPVSIHARHCWRARRAFTKSMITALQLFQSTPAIAGERDINHLINPASAQCFNPRPPLLASETITPPVWWRRNTSFNPRPPLLASETPRCPCWHRCHCVSIHARHCWRARPGCRRRPGRWPSFNPRPPLLASETLAAMRASCIASFQSTPAIAGERDAP